MRFNRQLVVGGVLTAGLVGAIGAAGYGVRHVAEPRPTPAPRFGHLEKASRAEIIEYASQLAFDTSYHAIDTRRLTPAPGKDPRSEPLVTIAPEIGVTALSDADFTGGRIVLRLTASGPSKRYGLAKGENYIWMDQVSGELRAVIIPADSSIALVRQSVRVLHRRLNAKVTAPRAQFRWNDLLQREIIWYDCGGACCEMFWRPPR